VGFSPPGQTPGIPMAPAPTTADHEGMATKSRPLELLRRLSLDTVYLVLGLPVGIVAFTVLVTGWSLALGLLITLIGIPIAMLTIQLSRGLAWLERRRAALVYDEPIAGVYREPATGRFLDRLKAMLADAQTWKDVAWNLVLAMPLGVAGFTVAVTAWGTVVGLIFMPAWWWAVPETDPVDLGLFQITSSGQAWIATAIGLVALPLAAALVRGSAAGIGALARIVLGPGEGQLRERVEVLSETRAGAVDAAAAELTRIERDLHDGAQARLVALALDLGMAEDRFERDPEGARELVEKARGEAKAALGELRDLARGIRPALLAERGLGEAIAALAARTPLPTTVEVEVAERLPAPVELAAYFTVAEGLTNAVKHAEATTARVHVWRERERLRVEIRDDGRGGARENGQGLDGLRKRLAALDGTLAIASPEGGPTVLYAEVPCGS
jgi:signal transduction histidine kinase